MPAKCKDCGIIYNGFDFKMVMLKDELWSQIVGSDWKICLCDRCIESRLDRSIRKEDFKLLEDGNQIWCNLEYMKRWKMPMTKAEIKRLEYMQNKYNSKI